MNSNGTSGAGSVLKSYPRTYNQAKIMARLACLAVGIRAVYTFLAYLLGQPSHEELIAKMRHIRGPVSLDEASVDLIIFERVASVFFWISTAVTILILLFCVGLIIWQWIRPGRLMPLICLAIMVLSVLLSLNALMDERLREMAMGTANLILWGLKPLLAILLIAAYRGGKVCEQYRNDPA